MSRLVPVGREELVKRLRSLGFDGPYRGGRHLFMVRDQLRLVIPNPHRSEISVDLLARILERINALSVETMEDLGEALLDFREISDLSAWLDGPGGRTTA